MLPRPGPATTSWSGRALELGPVDVLQVEGTGSYGAGLTRLLRQRGDPVVEVNRPERIDPPPTGQERPRWSA